MCTLYLTSSTTVISSTAYIIYMYVNKLNKSNGIINFKKIVYISSILNSNL